MPRNFLIVDNDPVGNASLVNLLKRQQGATAKNIVIASNLMDAVNQISTRFYDCCFIGSDGNDRLLNRLLQYLPSATQVVLLKTPNPVADGWLYNPGSGFLLKPVKPYQLQACIFPTTQHQPLQAVFA